MTYAAVAYGTAPYAGPEAEAQTTAGDPFLSVEIAFTTAPGASEQAYVDVSQDCRVLSFGRGKQRELERYQAGQGGIVLSNHDRRYDPNHAAGPWYGHIKPQKRIRISETFNGVTYPLFEGFIDSWDQQRNGPNDATCTVSFTDGFKVLARATLPPSAYAAEVLADEPAHWWRLGEPVGSDTAFDRGSAIIDGEYSGAMTLGVAGLVSREADTAVTFTEGSSASIIMRKATPSGTGPFTIEYVYENATSGGSRAIFSSNPGGGGNGVSMSITASGNLSATVGSDSFFASPAISDTASHHVALTRDGEGNLTVYLDGVVAGTGFDATALVLRDLYWGHPGGGAPNSFGGTIDELAVYTSALSADRIAAHATAVTTPWNNDTPGQRAGRVLDAVGWPENRRDLDTGTSTLQSATLGIGALEHLQKVAESEFGGLFVSVAGNVRLVSRQSRWNRTAVGTLTDDDDYQASDLEYGEDLIKNDVTVSRNEGVSQNVRDDTSISEYLIASYTADGLVHDDDLLSRHAAQYLVDVYKDPLQRIARLVVMPSANPSRLWPLLLGLELGAWLTVTETPQDVGSAFTQTAVIEGISYERQGRDFMFTLDLSPADTRPYWLAGVDGYSNAGASTRPGF